MGVRSVNLLVRTRNFTSGKKVVRMNKSQFAKRVMVGSGFLLLFAVPGVTRTQNSLPSRAQTPRMAAPAARPKRDTPLTDDFAGLIFTDEQKPKIDQIHKDMELRMDAVVQDEKLDMDQKRAMLEGLQRMASRQIFKVLTLEQKIEVRRKVLARRAAEREENKKGQQLPREVKNRQVGNQSRTP